ncbi:MAG: serpin family protein [Bacteroidota bacterium]|nr:serpin family protein [Bacteroidota bacterium]
MNKVLFAIIALIVIFVSCSKETTAPVQPSPPRALTQTEMKLVEADNSFGLKLFHEINKTEANKNLFISPLSVSMVLGMTLNGASGSTYDSMQHTLEYEGLTEQEINEGYKNLIILLTSLDPKVQFQIANSIWHRLELQVEQEFVSTNKNYFNADVTGLDFSSPSASPTINSWIEQKTNGKIKRIVPDQIPWSTVMYLINAIYFKGTWKYEFKKELTQEAPFYLTDGSQKACELMKIDGEFSYVENEQFLAIDLPYGNEKFSMTVFLPKQGVNIDAFVFNFTKENWETWIKTFMKREGTLFLPKFKIEYEKLLNDMLKAMGMEIAFDESRADFTRINKNGGLFISNVKHKTFVDVNEEGTEAAAVTSVEIDMVSYPPSKFNMRVDRPFVFVLREHHSQTILFVGKIAELTL